MAIAAYYQLAALDCMQSNWMTACEHLHASLDTNRQNNKASLLLVLAEDSLAAEQGVPLPPAQMQKAIERVLEYTPLDHWARHHPLSLCRSGDVATQMEMFLSKTRKRCPDDTRFSL